MNKVFKPFGRLVGKFSGFGSHPTHDWHLMLSVFFITLCVSVAIDAMIFGSIYKQDKIDIISDTKQSISIDREEVKRVISQVEQREMNARNIPDALNEDPSI